MLQFNDEIPGPLLVVKRVDCLTDSHTYAGLQCKLVVSVIPRQLGFLASCAITSVSPSSCTTGESNPSLKRVVGGGPRLVLAKEEEIRVFSVADVIVMKVDPFELG